MKRILIAADVNSAHTVKWAVSLAEKGFSIGIFTISAPENNWYGQYKNIEVFTANKKSNIFFRSKISYILFIPQIKSVIKLFEPDVVHSHYATSYGMLGAYSGYRPLIISCWGSDVMNFPNKSFLHKIFLKKILRRADLLLATSPTIQEYIKKIINKQVYIIPFGIDTGKFSPRHVKPMFPRGTIVISAIKSLEKIYCIDILIKAFNIIKKRNPHLPLKLLLVGGGSQEDAMRKLVTGLQMKNDVVFTGKVAHEETPYYHNLTDIFVNISEHESFGVSVLEAMACGKVVIASDTGGLKDLVKHEVTGLLVPVKNIERTAEAIECLIKDNEKKSSLEKNARNFVFKNYEWNRNVDDMVKIYNKMTS